MKQSMVTGRMSEEKKKQGTRTLERCGLNPSQAVNLLYDKIIQEGNADFLTDEPSPDAAERWHEAAAFVDSLAVSVTTRFDSMTKSQIAMDRLCSRGLV